MKVLIACGGTGGHLFPGMALAEAFEEKVPGVEIVFVGTARGLEKNVLSKTKWRLEMMQVASLADKKGFKKITASAGLLRSFTQSFSLLKKERPDLVVGTGGYASGPVVMTAALMKKPTLVLETNAIPGLTNLCLKHFVDAVVTAYPGMEKYFGNKKTKCFGIPVRKNILHSAKRVTSREPRVTIFIFGGSQGSKRINEAVAAALPYLREMKDAIHFIHQIGRAASKTEYEKYYRDNGFSAEVYPFIEQMAPFYAKTDFAICRSGAGSLAELAAMKIPAILIPYSHAARGHQEANARSLEKGGGAKVLLDQEVNGETLAGKYSPVRKSFTSKFVVLCRLEKRVAQANEQIFILSSSRFAIKVIFAVGLISIPQIGHRIISGLSVVGAP